MSGGSEILTLDPGEIIIPEDRLREVDPEKVAELAQSMAGIGQFTPIVVWRKNPAGKYILIAGAHRVAAAKQSGLTLSAVPFDGTPDEARILEIDENLYRAELTPYDQASFLAERRTIFERINGKVRPGRRGRGELGTNLSSKQTSFFDDITEKFGLPKKTVTRALRRHAAIAPEVWAQLRGHPVTKTASELDKLLKQHETVQRRIVRMLLQADRPAKNVTAALRALSDAPPVNPDDAQLEKLIALWGKTTSKKARAAFLDFLGSDEGRV